MRRVQRLKIPIIFPSFSHHFPIAYFALKFAAGEGHFDKADDQSMAQKPSSSSQVERAIPSRNEKSDRLCRDTNLSTTLLEKWDIMWKHGNIKQE